MPCVRVALPESSCDKGPGGRRRPPSEKVPGKDGEVATAGRTIIFVSHNMAAVSALCSRPAGERDPPAEWAVRGGPAAYTADVREAPGTDAAENGPESRASACAMSPTRQFQATARSSSASNTALQPHAHHLRHGVRWLGTEVYFESDNKPAPSTASGGEVRYHAPLNLSPGPCRVNVVQAESTTRASLSTRSKSRVRDRACRLFDRQASPALVSCLLADLVARWEPDDAWFASRVEAPVFRRGLNGSFEPRGAVSRRQQPRARRRGVPDDGTIGSLCDRCPGADTPRRSSIEGYPLVVGTAADCELPSDGPSAATVLPPRTSRSARPPTRVHDAHP